MSGYDGLLLLSGDLALTGTAEPAIVRVTTPQAGAFLGDSLTGTPAPAVIVVSGATVTSGTYDPGTYGSGVYGAGLYGYAGSTPTVEVRGHYENLIGDPMTGTVTFTANLPALIVGAADLVLVSAPVTVTLDTAGEFTVRLPAAGGTGITPNEFRYVVEERLTGVPARRYPLAVDVTDMSAGIDLADVTPPIPVQV